MPSERADRMKRSAERSFPIRPASGDGQMRLVFLLTAVVLSLALLLQGTAWPRHMPDFFVQICAVPLLIVMARRLSWSRPTDGLALFEGVFPLLLFILLLSQLVPVPPIVRDWFSVDEPVAGLRQIVGGGSWQPISLTPRGTLAALLSLVCPTILYYSVKSLSWERRRQLLVVIFVFSILNVIVALSQSAFWQQGLFNFYGNATRWMSTGVFASQNHYPAILYMVMPFAFATTLRFWNKRRWPIFVLLPVLVTIVCLLVLGALLSRSRAGMTLTLLSFLLSSIVFMPWTGRKWLVIFPITAIIIAPVLYVVDSYFGRISARLGADPVEDYRGAIFATTINAIYNNFPLGTGFGSFVSVYQMNETSNRILPAFVNFAHNDYLQIILEGGAAGLLLIAAFIIWYGLKVIGLLSGRGGSGRYEMRAAAMALFLVLLHTLVEYPLRTGALAAVFAVFCAFLIDPPGEKDAGNSSRRTVRRSSPRSSGNIAATSLG